MYRKSYFLFSEKTWQFVDKFQSNICDSLLGKDDVANKAEQFLLSLIDKQNLSKNFPELKIDSYK